jgi:hypothetical protein
MAAPRRPYMGGNNIPDEPQHMAWVVLLMIGDGYLPGALVVAASLRRLKTAHDIVCMVTPDISETVRVALRQIYDRVVEVPYIEHAAKQFKTKSQVSMYAGWIDRSFTKWNCLTLTEYDKVILLDADMVALTNCDDLFEMTAPAATYSNPWAYPWKTEMCLSNPYISKSVANHSRGGGRGRGRGSGNCRASSACDFPHGAKVPPAAVLTAVTTGSFVGAGGLVLLEPSVSMFDELIALINSEKVFGKNLDTVSGADEVSIALVYASAGVSWTHLHQRYQAIPWKQDWVKCDIRIYHYFGRKPWHMAVAEWQDLSDWWDEADRIVVKFPLMRSVFYPTVESVTPLDADLTQLRLTNDIRHAIAAHARKSPRYKRDAQRAGSETDSIVERWLMTMVNSQSPPHEWATVYRVSPSGGEYNRKLAGELIERKIVSSPADADAILGEVLKLVELRLAGYPGPTNAAATCTDSKISYGSHFSVDVTARIATLIKMRGCDAAVAVALRYAVVVSAGQQWGLPQQHVDYLYDEFNVRNEAFASPLNARLLGKDGAAFCSVFPDTDAPFGAIGEFFAQDLNRGGNWVINPPFVESIMARAANVVVDSMHADHPVTVFFVIPAWTDSEVYRILHGSQLRIAELHLEGGTYFYEDPLGKRVRTRASSIYFALSTESAAIQSGLKAALDHYAALI